MSQAEVPVYLIAIYLTTAQKKSNSLTGNSETKLSLSPHCCHDSGMKPLIIPSAAN